MKRKLLNWFSSFNASYNTQEKVDLITIFTLALFFFTGLGLCYYSFDFDASPRLVHLKMNFAGLIIVLILPASASLIFGLCRKISGPGVWQYSQAIWEKFLPYMMIAAPTAFYYSSGRGYMSASATIAFVLAWIAAMFIAGLINYRLRQACQTAE